MSFLGPECVFKSVGPANNLLTTFISTIVALHCNITTPRIWPRDFGIKALEKGLEDYDFVIIGAGTAGSVVAGRLAEDPSSKILLIEAGGNPPIESEIPGLFPSTFYSNADWQYSTLINKYSCQGMKGQFCTLHRGKVLGGSHSISAAAHLRGNAHDYNDWKEQGNPTWGWDDLLYYFRKTENFQEDNIYTEHGIEGPMNVESFQTSRKFWSTILSAAEDLGYEIVDDFVAGNDLGFGTFFGTLQNGRKMTTAKAFLTRRRPNLHVIRHAVAKQIFFTDDMKAESVRFVFREHYEMEVKVKKEIILSAGSIETPKLLMLSGIGPKQHLKPLGIPCLVNLPVGNNLQDHTKVDFFIRFDYQRKQSAEINFLDAFYDQWVHRIGPFAAGHVQVTGYLNTERRNPFPDIQYLFAQVWNITETAAIYKDHIAESLATQVGPYEQVLSAHVVLLKPKSKGFIRLGGDDYRDEPIIDTGVLREESDLKTLIRGMEKLIEFEETDTFRALNARFLRPDLPECDVYDFGSSRYWRCYVKYMSSTAYDPVGTAKMGPRNDGTTVVNSELKVHGVSALRVIDASVMPTIVSAPTNTPTIMIGEKGAEFVKNSWER